MVVSRFCHLRSRPGLVSTKQSSFLRPVPGPIHKGLCSFGDLSRKGPGAGSSVRLKYLPRAVEDSSQVPTKLVFPDQFDLPTAVALAGCAFEAYLEPEGEDDWKTTNANGTTTFYTNREILALNLDGFLQITLKSASNLPGKDITGKSDPYVQVSIDESFGQSKKCVQTLEPKWNETFLLSVRDLEKDVLRMRVRDHDYLKSDDELGCAMYPVNAFEDKGNLDLNLELQGIGGGGVLSMSVKYLPFEGQIPGEEAMDTSKWEDLGESFEASALPNSWTDLAVMAGKKADERFDPVCYVENSRTDSQAWIYCSDDRKRKEAVIAFRGTEQTKWQDLMTDANLQPASFDFERTDKLIMITDKILSRSNQKLLVHKGFLDAYDSIKQSIFTVVDDLIGDGEGWTVYVTGHSLGGALATMCSFELASRRSFLPEIQMYNYGSPRVGNKIFAEAFNEMVPVSWRIANRKDLVVTVPKLMGYTHVRNLAILNAKGVLRFGVDSKDKADDLDVDLKEARRDGALKREMGVTADPEMDFLTGIANGSGVADHMEAQYFSFLCECVSSNSRDETHVMDP